VKSFFKLSKKEEKIAKLLSTKSKKLPKNFANQVLDFELKIDSGQFDI
jgi:methionyl-tRNA synthetase